MKLTKALWLTLPAGAIRDAFKPIVPAGKTEDDAEEYDNGEEDAAGLKSALDKERKSNAAIKEEKRKADEAAELAKEEAARKSGDVAALEESWKKKMADGIKAEQGKYADLKGKMDRMLVTEVAARLATEISTVPELMTDAIAKRLGVDLDGDMPTTRVLDANGKPTAATLDELKAEFLAVPKFAGILIGGSSTGGGAGSGKPGAGGFTLETYKNADGSVNWGKVNTDNQKDPTVLVKVQEAITPGAGTSSES